MRRTTILLACVMIAPLAFAQTRTAQTKAATTQMSTEPNTIGTVVSFTPGQKIAVPSDSIVVQSSPNAKPMTYVLGKKVRYVDKAGRAFDPHLIRGGTRVQLGFDRAGAVRRVIVFDKG